MVIMSLVAIYKVLRGANSSYNRLCLSHSCGGAPPCVSAYTSIGSRLSDQAADSLPMYVFVCHTVNFKKNEQLRSRDRFHIVSSSPSCCSAINFTF